MSASVPAASVSVPDVSVRRARVLGLVLMLIAVVVFLAFGLGAEPGLQSRLGMNPARGETYFRFPDLVVPSRATAIFIAAVCAFFGGIQLARGFIRGDGRPSTRRWASWCCCSSSPS